MATKTRAEMIDFTLQYLGVLGAGQSANANDAAVVGSVIDAVHPELRKAGLASFATSAFPDWAWLGFVKAISEEAAPFFGLARPGFRRAGERELARQMEAKKHEHAIEAEYY
jgi:hypothetical protein